MRRDSGSIVESRLPTRHEREGSAERNGPRAFSDPSQSRPLLASRYDNRTPRQRVPHNSAGRALTPIGSFSMMRLSKFATLVQPSATLAAGAKARQMRADGATVYDFSLGEPDQTTPWHICQAAEEALVAGHTHYTPAGGIAELRA